MEVVKVKRELLEACLSCSICMKLLRDATTISECLHTFCRKCIYEKFIDEELECCPKCSINLGCVPVEKLRADHKLQDAREKIFPLKIRKTNPPAIPPSITLPVRRKERSLSSLVVNTPKVEAAQSTLTGRRTKAFIRKMASLRGSNSASDDDGAEDHGQSSSSQEHISKRSSKNRQKTSHGEPSSHFSNKLTVPKMENSESWKPLNCLVEAASQTKSNKYNPQAYTTKPQQSNGHDSELNVHKNKYKVPQDDKESSKVLVTAKPKRLLGSNRKRARELCSSTQALINDSSVRRDKGSGPIWLSLIASADQEGGALPQIPARYLRIKDGNAPVSFIQKYLARKLDLASESEVDITCRGHPLVPMLKLNKLVDQWLPTPSTQKSRATVGNSAKEFVMIVNYGRKPLASS